MLVSAPQLGFSITSPFKAIAKGIYHVARDPNVQHAAVAAGQQYGQQYAPAQYAQAGKYIQQGRQIQRMLRPPGAPPPPSAAGDDTGGDDAPAAIKPSKLKPSHGLFTVAAIAGAGLVLVLLLKK